MSFGWGTNTLTIFTTYSKIPLKSITFFDFISFEMLASITAYLSLLKSFCWKSFYYYWLFPWSKISIFLLVERKGLN